jgi:hypothetical protein
LWAENVDVRQARFDQRLNCGFVDGFVGSPELGEDDVEHDGCEAGDAEVVEGVEEDDARVLTGDCGGGECWREDGVSGYEVEEGGFAGARGVVGWWWGDEFDDWGWR